MSGRPSGIAVRRRRARCPVLIEAGLELPRGEAQVGPIRFAQPVALLACSARDQRQEHGAAGLVARNGQVGRVCASLNPRDLVSRENQTHGPAVRRMTGGTLERAIGTLLAMTTTPRSMAGVAALARE